jgi:hypothetical protein
VADEYVVEERIHISKDLVRTFNRGGRETYRTSLWGPHSKELGDRTRLERGKNKIL